jgi:hypothetical protein
MLRVNRCSFVGLTSRFFPPRWLSARPTAFVPPVPRWFGWKQKHQMIEILSKTKTRKSVRHTKIATKGVRSEVNSLIFSCRQTYRLFTTTHRITMETGERDMFEDDQKPAALPQHELPEETDHGGQEFGILVSSTWTNEKVLLRPWKVLEMTPLLIKNISIFEFWLAFAHVAAKFLKLVLYLLTVEPKFADELDLIGSWKTYVRVQIAFSKTPSTRSSKRLFPRLQESYIIYY